MMNSASAATVGRESSVGRHGGGKAAAFFEQLWKRDEAGWANLENTEWQAVYERQIAMVRGRPYDRALEIGCGAGCLTTRLACIAGQLVALDIAPTALDHARRKVAGSNRVDFRVANIMEFDVGAEGPWDLIVMTDTIYYLGSLYTFFEMNWLASALFAATSSGGRLLLANASSEGEDEEVMCPPVIRSYRDLFLNVGYCLEAEEVFPAGYWGVKYEVLISTLGKRRNTRDAIGT
jgi:SAM-dependent methyltransferase